eukprot:179113-Rhodomonas_salina.1
MAEGSSRAGEKMTFASGLSVAALRHSHCVFSSTPTKSSTPLAMFTLAVRNHEAQPEFDRLTYLSNRAVGS